MNESSTSSGPMVNGESITGLIDSIRKRPGGDALVEKIISALPPESAGVCTKKIITVGYYPYSVFVDLIRTADRLAGRGDLKFCRELGKYRASDEIKGFLKIMDSSASLEDLFRSGPALWKTSRINSGYMEVVDSSPDNSALRICDFPQMDPAHCIYMEGYFTQAMVEAGAVWIEEVRETRCASRGDDCHEFAGKWRPAKK